TLLEQKDDFTVTSLVIYPGSLYKMKNPHDSIRQIIAVSGKVTVESGGRVRRLVRGKAVVILANGFIPIMNQGSGPSEVICVEMGSKA
ncbi:MAG: hypothetical protein Q8M56_06560, partial [Desulfobacterales bacterium]|nr:hypothetical protein [Desulfobacterales bacterium]